MPEYAGDLVLLERLIVDALEHTFSAPQTFPDSPIVVSPHLPTITVVPTTLLSEAQSDVSTTHSLSSYDITLTTELKRSHYSITYEGILKTSYERVMVKKPLLPSDEADHPEFLANLTQMWTQEVNLLTLVGGGSHLCRLIGASIDGTPDMAIVYEYVGKTYLRDLLTEDFNNPESSAQTIENPIQIALDIAKSLKHLHSLSIIHRDIKSANIMIDSKGKAKLVDFTLACFIDNEEDLKPETGTYRYMAPEVIRHEPYSLPADVYSFGIFLWELHTKSIPYGGLSPIEAAFGVAKNNLRPSIPEGTNSKLKALMLRCWHPNPDLRPTFRDICLLLSNL